MSTPDLTQLAEATGLSLEQIEAGLAIMRSGDTHTINMVITGKITVAEALAVIRRRRTRNDNPYRSQSAQVPATR